MKRLLRIAFDLVALAALALPILLGFASAYSPIHIGKEKVWILCWEYVVIDVQNSGGFRTYYFTAMPLMVLCSGIPAAAVALHVLRWKCRRVRASLLIILLGLIVAWPALVIFRDYTEAIPQRIEAAEDVFYYLCMFVFVPALVIRGLAFLAGIPARRREAMVRQGLCLQCGYNLAGNQSGICPECGTRAIAG